MEFSGVQDGNDAILGSFGFLPLQGSELPAYHTLQTGPKCGEPIEFEVPSAKQHFKTLEKEAE